MLGATPTPKTCRRVRRLSAPQIFCEIPRPHLNRYKKLLGWENSEAPSLAPNHSRGVLPPAGVRRGPMKKQEDARLAVLREYDRWAKEHPDDAKKMGGYVFFGYLEKEKPNLLDFRASGSKWQIVHMWLRHGGRLKD